MTENPFGVKNPEDLSPEYIALHFVDMFTDFSKVRIPENSFVHGARGTGKSMMMRGLETAVMLKTRKWSIKELPHIGVHVPLRRGDFAVPELNSPAPAAALAISEHILVVHIVSRLARSLLGVLGDAEKADAYDFAMTFARLYHDCGGSLDEMPDASRNADDQLRWIMSACDRESTATRQFIKRVVFDREKVYSGALCAFLDFLLPLVSRLTQLPSMPRVPVFVMLDDADNLPVMMQRIVNTWVARRAVEQLCLKVTTQLGYATYRTVDSRLIEAPHDFSEIDIASVYSKRHDRFHSRVREIVSTRLKLAGITAEPEAFFPSDLKQQAAIEAVKEALRQEWEERQTNASATERVRGAARSRDEVIRYAIPRYMRSLSGSSKSSHTYSYAGFDSLVDLSSGVIRWFLEPAARMFDEVSSRAVQPVISSIPCGVQDEVIYGWSRDFAERSLTTDVRSGDAQKGSAESDVPDDGSLQALGHEGPIAERLRRLILALGQFFRKRLLSPDSSEQRAFSVVVRGPISADLRDVLAYGVRRGYLQKTDNAAKESIGGRNPRYILSRRLGPYFKLDVSGYAAHISVTADDLEIAMEDPKRFVAMRSGDVNSSGQLPLMLNGAEEEEEDR